MRVLHILHHSAPFHSGYALRTLAVLKAQRERGWETLHLTGAKHAALAQHGYRARGRTEPSSHSPHPESAGGYEFFRTPSVAPLPGIPYGYAAAALRSTASRLLEVARAERPDILHAHSPASNALAALWVRRRLGIPVLYEVRTSWEDSDVAHGMFGEGNIRYRISRAIETAALHRVDEVVALCEGVRAEVIDRGVPAQKVSVVPNGVDPEAFDADGADPVDASEIGLEGKLVIGFIGTFFRYEGLELLIDALSEIRRSFPEAVLLLVGGGPIVRELKQRVRDRNLTDCVVFTGTVEHSQVPRYYQLMDVCIYPRISLRLTENITPLKPLEAMAARTPVMASDIGGHREMIREPENGFLFPPGDVSGLVQKFHEVIAQRPHWPELTDRARRYAERERHWCTSVRGYEDPYTRLWKRSPFRDVAVPPAPQ